MKFTIGQPRAKKDGGKADKDSHFLLLVGVVDAGLEKGGIMRVLLSHRAFLSGAKLT